MERKLEEEKPDRLFIDDLMAFFTAVESPFKSRSLTDDLFGLVRNSGINIGHNHRHGLRHEPHPGVRSRLGNNAQQGRIGNVMIRSLYIMKMRGSRIANTIRVLDISDDGMSVSTLSPYP